VGEDPRNHPVHKAYHRCSRRQNATFQNQIIRISSREALGPIK
jgi:hypothetical protein